MSGSLSDWNSSYFFTCFLLVFLVSKAWIWVSSRCCSRSVSLIFLSPLVFFYPSPMSEIVIRARFVIPDRFYTRFVWIHDSIWACCVFFILFCKQFLGYFKTKRSRSSWLFSTYPRFLYRGKKGHHELNSCQVRQFVWNNMWIRYQVHASQIMHAWPSVERPEV